MDLQFSITRARAESRRGGQVGRNNAHDIYGLAVADAAVFASSALKESESSPHICGCAHAMDLAAVVCVGALGVRGEHRGLSAATQAELLELLHHKQQVQQIGSAKGRAKQQGWRRVPLHCNPELWRKLSSKGVPQLKKSVAVHNYSAYSSDGASTLGKAEGAEATRVRVQDLGIIRCRDYGVETRLSH